MTHNTSTRYRLIVFDWDDTLTDSATRMVACMQRAAADTHQPVPTPTATRNLVDLSLDQAIQRLFPGANKVDVENLTQAYLRYWRGDALPFPILFPNAAEMLHALAEAGYLLAVATGKNRHGLDKDMAATGLTHRFHATRCADETVCKPHPQMLHEILVDLNIEAQHAMVVGDTEYDMQMAANACVDAVGVAHGVHDAQRLQEHGALTVFTDLREIPDWLADT